MKLCRSLIIVVVTLVSASLCCAEIPSSGSLIPAHASAFVYFRDIKETIKTLVAYPQMDQLHRMNPKNKGKETPRQGVENLLATPFAQLIGGPVVLGTVSTPEETIKTRKGVFLVAELIPEGEQHLRNIIDAFETLGNIKSLSLPADLDLPVEAFQLKNETEIYYWFKNQHVILTTASDLQAFFKSAPDTIPDWKSDLTTEKSVSIYLDGQGFLGQIPLKKILNGRLKNPVVKRVVPSIKSIVTAIDHVLSDLWLDNGLGFNAKARFTPDSEGLALVKYVEMNALPVEVSALGRGAAAMFSANLNIQKILSKFALSDLCGNRDDLARVFGAFLGFKSLESGLLKDLTSNLSLIIHCGQDNDLGDYPMDAALFLGIQKSAEARARMQTRLDILTGIIQMVGNKKSAPEVIRSVKIGQWNGVAVDFPRIMKPEERKNWFIRSKELVYVLTDNGLIVATSLRMLQDKFSDLSAVKSGTPIRWQLDVNVDPLREFMIRNQGHMLKDAEAKGEDVERKQKELNDMIGILSCLKNFHVDETIDGNDLTRKGKLKLSEPGIR